VARVPLCTLLLVVLAATAGCSGSLAGPDRGDTETLTPAPVPGDPTPTLQAGELAPGLEDDGVVDPAHLVGAHTEALIDTSYTARLSTTRAAPNGSVRERYDRIVRVASWDRFRYVLTAESDGVVRRTDRWRSGDRAYEAVTENGTTTYRSLDSPSAPTLLSREGLLRLFRVLSSRVTDTRRSNGATVYRVVGGPSDLPTLSNVTYVAHVTDRGLVTSFRVSYAVDDEDREQRVTVEATVDRVGETAVERPEWYDEAT
jgi:hypothetical protein